MTEEEQRHAEYALAVSDRCTAAIMAVANEAKAFDVEEITLGLLYCLTMTLAQMGPDYLPNVDAFAGRFARNLPNDVRQAIVEIEANRPAESNAITTMN